VNQQDFCYFNSEALSAKSHLKFACLLANAFASGSNQNLYREKVNKKFGIDDLTFG
jgi:hypothetical protein